MQELFTIGCSTHSIDSFLKLLQKFNIRVVADVRSVPFSKFTPQFNADMLEKALYKNKIYYLNFSKEFGARRSELEAYTDNQVDFDKVKSLPLFKSGVLRIQEGLSKGFRIALMCTEKDPEDCHRFSLVAKGIYERANIDAKHILFDGNLITTKEIENKLITEYNLEPDLFETFDPVAQVYKKIEETVAYTNFT